MLLRIVALAALAPVIILAACGDDDEDAPDGDDNGGAATTAPAGGGDGGTIEVTASDFLFAGETIPATAGDTVTVEFANNGSAPHTFTIDGVVDVEAEGGESATSEPFVVPDEDVMFYCRYHPGQMQGTLSVGGDSSQSREDGGASGEGDPAYID